MKHPPKTQPLLDHLLRWDKLPLVLVGVLFAAMLALGIVIGFVGAALQ